MSHPSTTRYSRSIVFCLILTLACASLHPAASQGFERLPGTTPLAPGIDWSSRMVDGIDQFLTSHNDLVRQERGRHWTRSGASLETLDESVKPNRQRLASRLGIIDARLPISGLEYVGTTARSSQIGETPRFTAHNVRWPCLPELSGEGLLLNPTSPYRALVIALPDADQPPEMLCGLIEGLPLEAQYARRLAEQGVLVVIPTLISRDDQHSGNPTLNRWTNQPHREWIYRQAFQMGRHIIGLEIQQILALLDWFQTLGTTNTLPIAIAGWGEGGLLAFNAAALDPRIDVALVSGYFGSREQLWAEPIYRNVWAWLTEFGDAELASLIYPRRLLVEPAPAPAVAGPPPPRPGRSGAAPGRIPNPSLAEVESELQRAITLSTHETLPPPRFRLVTQGNETTSPPIAEPAWQALLSELVGPTPVLEADPLAPLPLPAASSDIAARQLRRVREAENFIQRLLRHSERERERFFWEPWRALPLEGQPSFIKVKRQQLWENVIGRLPPPDNVKPEVASRALLQTPEWNAYEVTFPVRKGLFAWGILTMPRDLQAGLPRPVIVCQHGLEGLPIHTLNGPAEPGHEYYRGFAARLAERGFITWSPHNPYRGQDRFRVLQRKANPLGLSLFSFIIDQHQRALGWLQTLPYVDPARIGFYGLSYGGKTAMRVPAILEDYALSICSADFNEWIRKNVTVDAPFSYLFTGEYEMPEFNLGNTFNYAEMAALIAPRPFMVERGHHDGVAPDEWVAYEYARVRRHYTSLGIAHQTRIEFFDGPHTIHGQGTFEFLHEKLDWPIPPPTGNPQSEVILHPDKSSPP